MVAEGTGTFEPSFICDLMLFKLCRWMRIAGMDVLFPIGLDDDGLFALSISTGRVLLTRDKDLSNRKGGKIIRLLSEDIDGQLVEICKAQPIICRRERPTRCPICNTMLLKMDRAVILSLPQVGQVPERVLKEHQSYFLCQGCDKVYWNGSHWARIEKKLRTSGLWPDVALASETEK